jgi:beta-amylase
MWTLFVLPGLVSSVCDVYVMNPAPMFDKDQNILNKDELDRRFGKLKEINVDGLMVDVFWNLCEPSEKTYKWTGYREVFNMLIMRGLKIMPAIAFHSSPPEFVNPAKPWFKGPTGTTYEEYISFGYDHVKITSRTPLEMYKEFMDAFNKEFGDLIWAGTVTCIEVGLGPYGELHYPSFQIEHGWKFPGCGIFQSYDDQLTQQLKAAAVAAGHPEWGHSPKNAGDQNVRPGNVEFWTNSTNGWNGTYGQWFIKWYSQVLLDHGRDVMKAGRDAFGVGTRLTVRFAGLHWWFLNPTHCTEVAAGVRDFDFYNGYRDIMEIFKEYDYGFDYSALEQGRNIRVGMDNPKLVERVWNLTQEYGVRFEAENAGECYNQPDYDRMKVWVPRGLLRLTFLRLTDDMMKEENFAIFTKFVADIHNA